MIPRMGGGVGGIAPSAFGTTSIDRAKADAADLQARALTGDRAALSTLMFRASSDPNVLVRSAYAGALARYRQLANEQAQQSTTTLPAASVPRGWTWLGPLPSASDPNPTGAWLHEPPDGAATRYAGTYDRYPWLDSVDMVRPLSLPTAAPALPPARSVVAYDAADTQAPRARDITGTAQTPEQMALVPVRSFWQRYGWALVLVLGGASVFYATRAR